MRLQRLPRELARLIMAAAIMGMLAGTPHHLANDHADHGGHAADLSWNGAAHDHSHELGDHDWTGTRRPVFTLELPVLHAAGILLPPAPSPQQITSRPLTLSHVWEKQPPALRGPPLLA